MDEPILYEGGLAVDDRGQLSFVNVLLNVKRFYIVTNHKSRFIRAWHAHKKEAKYVTVLQGSAIIGVVPIDNWENPSKDIAPKKFVLFANKPTVLYIPAGYANGFMNLTQDTNIMFLSTSSLEESKGDDYRYNAYYWDIWKIEER